MSDDLIDIILEANQKGYERAFGTAVRTGTALIFSRKGKTVEVKPPWRYVLVPIKSVKKKRSSSRRKKKLL